MAGKFLCVNLHKIWSTKNRRRLIDPQWTGRLYDFMSSIARAKNAKLIEVGSEPDHVHLYISMPSTITIADMVNAFKANSTRWVHQNFPERRLFSWQEGYAAFSVGRSEERSVIELSAIRMSIIGNRIFSKNFLNCSAVMELNLTCGMCLTECRTFGAHDMHHPDPDLTVGPIQCRAFGPLVSYRPQFNLHCETRREAPEGNSPERQLGVTWGCEMRPERPAHFCNTCYIIISVSGAEPAAAPKAAPWLPK